MILSSLCSNMIGYTSFCFFNYSTYVYADLTYLKNIRMRLATNELHKYTLFSLYASLIIKSKSSCYTVGSYEFYILWKSSSVARSGGNLYAAVGCDDDRQPVRSVYIIAFFFVNTKMVIL